MLTISDYVIHKSISKGDTISKHSNPHTNTEVKITTKIQSQLTITTANARNHPIISRANTMNTIF